ncbi:hypothetical protein Leryth_018973 [Lithospermum erythrorhizon]|nr:hypothetical protein Leryth_018973 [Lithospermum erythrorhizon]
MTKSESWSNSSENRPWQSYNTVYTNAKAGMDGVDKEKVQRVVYEMSKGSKYFENQERKDASIKEKIEYMRSQCANLTPNHLAHFHKIADTRIVELESTRDLSKIWLHVDMDAFFAAVETLCDQSLKGKPMAVGNMSMLSTANYEARKFGVRAAMPGFIARKLCPDLIFVPVDFKKYTHYSNLTREVFQKYDANFMAMSLDEAYLDITNICAERSMTGEQVAQELRETVFNVTGLTCSAGVAANRLLAKVCSDINKPNGQFVLPNERGAVVTFISSLPTRKIGGIGKVTDQILKEVIGISTCGELLQQSSFLYALFSRSSADFFLSVGLGLGETDTPEVGMRKSMSTERTFTATKNEAFLYQKLVDLSESLSTDLKEEGLSGRTLTLKLKTASFEVRTRAVTLPSYMCEHEDILKHASKLLKAELPVSLRLMERDDCFMSDHVLSTNHGTFENHESCCPSEIGLDTQLLGLKWQGNSLNQNRGGKEQVLGCQENNPVEHISDRNGKGRLSLKQHEGSDEVGAGPSTSEKRSFFWMDDYKCSICGVELPQSFLEERQEHSDFHLAERLQEEESCENLKSIVQSQRFTQKDQQRKKHKSSQTGTKHVPIDMFFAKRS